MTVADGLLMLRGENLWQIVSAIGSTMAATAAAVAVWQASAFWRREKRSQVYDEVVRRPLVSAVEGFVESAQERATPYQGLFRHLQDTQALEGAPHIEQAIKEFSEIYFRYKGRVRRCRLGWGDQELSADLLKEVEYVQDRIVEYLAEGMEPGMSIGDELDDHAARVMRLVNYHDPALR